MPPYRHTQIGYVILGSLSVALILVAVLLRGEGSAGEWATLLGFFLLIAIVFSTLTVELRDRTLRIWFGPGFPRWRWPLNEIASARAVRTPWYVGWGIRWAGYWLYNVSGLDAVELTLRNGRKLRIGTDEPQALLTALQQAGVR